MALCTYCDRELDGSKEHVVQSAIGGRLWSMEILCSRTNAEFGSSFDRDFTESLAIFSNVLNITTGRGESPATLRNVPVAGGKRINLLPGALPMETRPTVDVEHRDGKTHVTVHADASDAESARRILDQVARRYRPEGAKGLEVTSRRGHRFYREPIEMAANVNSPAHRRAVAKIALNLLVHELGTAVGRSPAFARLRELIVNGTPDDELVWLDYKMRQPALVGLGSPSPGSHLVLVSGHAVDGLVVGVVDIFQLLRYSIVMSRSWQGHSFVLGHTVDPVSGRAGSFHGASEDAISLSDLKERGPSNEAFDVRASALSQYMHDRTVDAAVSSITREAMEAVFVGPPGQDTLTITEEHIDRFSHLVAARFTDLVFKTDREFAVDSRSAPRGQQSSRRSRRRKR